MAQCPKCGSNISGRFCPNCGAQVTPESQGAAAAMPTPPQPPQQPGFPPQPPQGFQPQQPGFPPQPPQGFQPGPYPGMQPVQQKSSVMKWVWIGLAVVTLLLGALIWLGSGDDTGDQAQQAVQNAIVSVGAPVFTDKVDEASQKPVRTLQSIPTSTDKIYAAVQVKVKKGQVLSAKWYYQGNHQAQLDTQLPVDSDFSGWGAFNIDNGGQPWPKGTLKVEVYLDNQLKQSASIDIK